MAEAKAKEEAKGEVREYLSVDKIRKCDDLKPADVYIDAWDGWVQVRPLTFEERRSVRKAAEEKITTPTGQIQTEYDNEKLELEAFVKGVVQPKFERSAIGWLKTEKLAGAISNVVRKIFEMSGMTVDALKNQERS